MNAYWTAQLDAIWSGEAPTWEALLLDDTGAGHILLSEDDGDTWRRARVEDDMGQAALALQGGRAGQTIKMTSRGEAIMLGLAPDYAPLLLGQVGEDGRVALDFREDGA